MATKSRKSARKSGRSTTRGTSGRGKTRAGGRKSSARKGGMKKSARRGGMKKSAARKGGMKKSARKGGAKKAGARKASARKRSGGRQSAVARVKRVAREVAQQATVAVTSGVDTIREFGGNLVERVRED